MHLLLWELEMCFDQHWLNQAVLRVSGFHYGGGCRLRALLHL